ncbi:unnamed protein product [Cyprideis torosa]|uniref:Uncharacterized protein n=1 Tax=Cyprideis torosa TaxID=163714 RepID=A0A7R8W545_9CRUS|nr:unnamed protein product [Cyprideis torosa]CAG0883862.1 unnamed protein product [Cyprideis torosa]
MGFVDSSLLPLKLLLFTFYGDTGAEVVTGHLGASAEVVTGHLGASAEVVTGHLGASADQNCGAALAPFALGSFLLFSTCLGCVLPFLTAHLRWLGFSSQEATFVQSVTPFVLVLGPPIAGIIADKLGRLKTLLILCLLLSEFFDLMMKPEASWKRSTMRWEVREFGHTYYKKNDERVLSPRISERVLSLRISERVLSPRISERVLSPRISERVLSPRISERVLSPIDALVGDRCVLLPPIEKGREWSDEMRSEARPEQPAHGGRKEGREGGFFNSFSLPLAASIENSETVSGLSLTALLFVPALPRTRSSWTPNITFTCSPEASAVVVNKCGDTCPIPARRHLLSFSVSACRIRCNHTVFPDRLRRTMGGYPNLCVSKFGEPDPERSQCREMGATFEEDPFLFSSPLPRYVKKPFTCYYPLILFQYQGEEYTRLSCPNVEPGCAVWCDAKETVAPYPSHARPAPAEGVPEQINKLRRSPRPGFNDSSVCRVAQEGTAAAPGELRLPRSRPHGALWNSPLWSFFLYLSLRSLAELLPATAVALLNTLTLTVLSAHPLASFGQQHLWAVMGFGFFAPLCGYLMDYHRGLFGVADFAPCFYALDALLLLSALLVAVLPVPFPRPRENKWWRNLSVHILASGQVWALFGLALVCGVFWGALEIFLPPYLLELGSSRLTLGLGVTAGVLPAIPLLFFSRPILRLAGCFNLGAIALIVYALRQAGSRHSEAELRPLPPPPPSSPSPFLVGH